jgi:hypothetical protein
MSKNLPQNIAYPIRQQQDSNALPDTCKHVVMVVEMAETTLLQPVFSVTTTAIEGRCLPFQADIGQISETASRKEVAPKGTEFMYD